MSENEDIIKLAAATGAKAALDTLAKEKAKEGKLRSDRRLRNTKLLLRNYRSFKKHKENAIYKVSQLDESAVDILDLMWDPNDRSGSLVKSIKNSAARTVIIMEHIDEMLRVYDIMCARSGKPEVERKFRVLCAMYIVDDAQTAETIAKFENIDVRTVYKDIDAACEKMAALIFGVDFSRE